MSGGVGVWFGRRGDSAVGGVYLIKVGGLMGGIVEESEEKIPSNAGCFS